MATTKDKYGNILGASYQFKGMNNCMDASKLPEGYSPFLVNVDLDDLGGVYRRDADPYTGIDAVGLTCFWHGRTYTADGDTVYFSDTIEGIGIREYGKILEQFDSTVTMLVEMVDGLYVGTQDKVYYISGGDPMLGNLKMEEVHQYGAVPGTCVKVENENVGVDSSGYSIIFLSHNGINIGDNSGNVKNVTTNIVAIPKCMTGTAHLRTRNNMTHYVVQIDSQAISTSTQFVPITPTDTD
jgi:hypothetical protein